MSVATLTTACQPWCTEDHNSPVTGDFHSGEILAVELSQIQNDQLPGSPNRVDYVGGGYCAVLLAAQYSPDRDVPVIALTNHDGMAEDILTVCEAEQLARKLLALVATLSTSGRKRDLHPDYRTFQEAR